MLLFCVVGFLPGFCIGIGLGCAKAVVTQRKYFFCLILLLLLKVKSFDTGTLNWLMTEEKLIK